MNHVNIFGGQWSVVQSVIWRPCSRYQQVKQDLFPCQPFTKLFRLYPSSLGSLQILFHVRRNRFGWDMAVVKQWWEFFEFCPQLSENMDVNLCRTKPHFSV